MTDEQAELAELQAADAWTRMRRAGDLIVWHQERVTEYSRMRREAAEELMAQGTKQTEMAKYLGVTRARMSKLLASGPKPARALLGVGRLTISVGGKSDGGSRASNPSAVISAETSAAYHVLKDLAADYNLEVSELDIVKPPGLIDLARPNLIVMTSPRLLPLVGQSLLADHNLAFQHGARGWYLEEKRTGTTFRSPSDEGEPCDYAYLGRLPRTDGNGTFLYLAGIHAMGTLGAAHYLADNIEDIYDQVKTKRWSTLIKCSYDPDTRVIQSTEAITDLYVA